MAGSTRSRRSQVTNYWPGFVDALSSLLLVIIFLLSLFMLSQFFLGQEILGKDTAMSLSSATIRRLSVDTGTPRRRAAAEKLPLSATAMNRARSSRFFGIPNYSIIERPYLLIGKVGDR